MLPCNPLKNVCLCKIRKIIFPQSVIESCCSDTGNKRSNSDPKMKKIVNYNRINVPGFENINYSYHMPKNINNLNSNNYNPTSPKCINKIKI